MNAQKILKKERKPKPRRKVLDKIGNAGNEMIDENEPIRLMEEVCFQIFNLTFNLVSKGRRFQIGD